MNIKKDIELLGDIGVIIYMDMEKYIRVYYINGVKKIKRGNGFLKDYQDLMKN